MEELELARLFFIPAAQSPFKPENKPAAAAVRIRLLRLALAGETRYEIDLQEIERGGTSYTIDTLRQYAQRFPKAELCYLIGADHVRALPQWRAADELARLARFIVVPRPGEAPADAPAPFRAEVLKGFPLGLSSSQVRARVQAGRSVRGLVPPAVAEIISNEKLYL